MNILLQNNQPTELDIQFDSPVPIVLREHTPVSGSIDASGVLIVSNGNDQVGQTVNVKEVKLMGFASIEVPDTVLTHVVVAALIKRGGLSSLPVPAGDVGASTSSDLSTNKMAVRLASNANTNWTTGVTAGYKDGVLYLGGLTAGTINGKIDVVEVGTTWVNPQTGEVGERILLKDMATVFAADTTNGRTAANTGAFNGIWRAIAGTTTTLQLVRATDANNSAKVQSGMMAVVNEGSVEHGKIYGISTVNPIVLGTTALVFVAL